MNDAFCAKARELKFSGFGNEKGCYYLGDIFHYMNRV